MIPIRTSHPLIKIANRALKDLPAPSNISRWWNAGSLLGICLVIQLITGIFLSIHFTGDISIAFSRIIHICRDVNFGWLIRVIHANGASLFFLILFIHAGRGIYYGSFIFIETWRTGVIILFLVIATAFIGYVLPWGQISFWAATVITNLLSAIPYLGQDVVQWIWGGFAVDNATLSRFFSLHFLLPFIIAALVIIHLLFLHKTGSRNPLGINSNYEKSPFHPFFSFKDVFGFILATWSLLILSLYNPYLLRDVENFIPANPLVTPTHIQPEWYFLFAYAILRSIPNKLGGVLALVLSIAILWVLPFTSKSTLRGCVFYPINKLLFWNFLSLFILLTWIGARPAEDPYIIVGQIVRFLYFIFFIINPISSKIWDKKI